MKRHSMERFLVVVRVVVAIALLVASVTCFIRGNDYKSSGFYKINTYFNMEEYPSLSKNAYVGGDAYNYIINGTYFSGYSALSGSMYICSAVSGAAGCLLLLLPYSSSRKETGFTYAGSEKVPEFTDLPDL